MEKQENNEATILFSIQEIYCNICAKPFKTNFGHIGGYGRIRGCCSKQCWEEIEWRSALATLGKAYYKKPKEEPITEAL
jgi:hypothetical protein